MTLTPFERGQMLVWDATVTDSLAPSMVGTGAARPGHAVALAEAAKCRKYSSVGYPHLFSPLAFETLGGPGVLTKKLLNDVGRKLALATGDKRAGEYLLQRLSLDVQRGNAASVRGTLARWTSPSLDLTP